MNKKLSIRYIAALLLVCALALVFPVQQASASNAVSTSDAGLSALSVSPGTLSPEFTSGVYEYRVEVPQECDKILVNATPKDSGAKMVVAGNSGLKVGENPVYINVTAADGKTTAKYTITVVRGEGGAAGTIGDSPLAGPGAGQITGHSQSAASAGTISTQGKSYTLSEPDESLIPAGYTAVDLTVADQTFKAWKFPSGYGIENYYLVYGSDDLGRTGFYVYDVAGGTLLMAPDGLVTAGQEGTIAQNQLTAASESYQQTLQLRMYIIIGLAALCFILLIALTASMTRNKRRGRDDDYEDDYDDDDYEDDDYEDDDYEENYDGDDYEEDGAYDEDSFENRDSFDQNGEEYEDGDYDADDDREEYEEDYEDNDPVIPEEIDFGTDETDDADQEENDGEEVEYSEEAAPAAEVELEADSKRRVSGFHEESPEAGEAEAQGAEKTDSTEEERIVIDALLADNSKDEEIADHAAGSESEEGDSESEDDEDDLDADFDLLEALLSDSVRTGKADSADSFVERAEKQAGAAAGVKKEQQVQRSAKAAQAAPKKAPQETEAPQTEEAQLDDDFEILDL